jgi:3-phenylpropionate/cinnamic acid dioxygenase small subunit
MNADDYAAIHNLLFRYADLVDRGDFEAVGALFAHAVVYMPGDEQPTTRGAAELTAIFREFVHTYPETGGTPRTQHVTTNVLIEADGPDRARSQSYFTVYQSTPDFPMQPVIGGYYQDRFEKVDGTWRFTERREFVRTVGDLSRHLKKPVDY